MARYKIQAARQYRATEAGDRFEGWEIVGTVPGSPQLVIALPDDYDATAVQALMLEWERRGLIERDGRGLFRPEYQDYSPLWLPDLPRVYTNVEVADTWPMIGVTPETQERGKYGAGVILLHLDTGLDRNHVAFQGKNVVRADPDGHGHGTHTASTAGSAWGVAPDVTIWSKNVLPGGTGSEAGIANGIREAADYAVSQRAPAVLTMSLGGGPSSVIDDACSYARARGVILVSAAGNSGPSAPQGSPSRSSDLSVLACTRDRQYASFSSGPNWNTPNRCTAPGVDIAAAQSGTTEGVLVSSGTSMACPQIAGHCALLLAGGG